jgi:membrane-associated protease RseP (regulator of RpoE activity)
MNFQRFSQTHLGVAALLRSADGFGLFSIGARATLTAFLVLLVAADAARAAAFPVVVKFERKEGHVLVPVKINGRGPFMMGVDTGSPYAFVTTQVARQVGLGGGGAQLEIGELRLNNAPLTAMNHPNMKEHMSGILGYAFLSRYRFSIDFPNKEIIFHGPPDGKLQTAAPAPSRAFVCGIGLEDLGDDTRESRVVRVAAGSAAESAGLQRGDLITEINGVKIGAPPQLLGVLGKLNAGQTARLKVTRDGTTLELMMPLRSGL